MCDTLCLITKHGTFFAKNSDRPVGEAQTLFAEHERPPDFGRHSLPVQYMNIEDTGSLPCLLSRPTWLWGAEHGVNSKRVAIGNEKIYTIDDPYEAPSALIGMDLVRLALERASSAREAVQEIEWLLAAYGQGGIADRQAMEPYWSSFLIADPHEAWILETSANTWAAKCIDLEEAPTAIACISNRVTLSTDWDIASSAVPVGSDFDEWRSKDAPTAHADVRLLSSRQFLESIRNRLDNNIDNSSSTSSNTGTTHANTTHNHSSSSYTDNTDNTDNRDTTHNSTSDSDIDIDIDIESIKQTASSFAAHLRDHGTGPWGNPLTLASQAVPPPEYSLPDGAGVSVCMHIRSYQATSASMITFLPAKESTPALCWVALGSPCCSVYVPILPPDTLTDSPLHIPAILEQEATWKRFDDLRQLVEDDPPAITGVRDVLHPLENTLWSEAPQLEAAENAWNSFYDTASSALLNAFTELGI